MTITFLQPDGVPITAQAERQGSAPLNGAGFGRPLGGRSGFRVDTPSTVLTATATTWTLAPVTAMIDPGASTHQGMYGWASDANISGGVNAADATYDRKDIVYIQVNDSSAGDGSGAKEAPVLYLAGTPNASPVAPALPVRSFLVGTITVPKVGGGSPSVALNPARFVAAGARLPVASAADRPTNPHLGQEIVRLDRNNHVQAWGGTAWRWVSRPERYYANVTDFNQTGGSVAKLIGTVTAAPTRSYATQARVNGRLSVICGAINQGAQQIKVSVSIAQTSYEGAQAKSRMVFVSPGGYALTASAETNWIPVAAGAPPVPRIWTEPVSGEVSHGALNLPAESHLWVEVLPAED